MRLPLVLAVCLAAPAAMADMSAQLLPPWDGRTIPAGQHCTIQGGKGGTPPMQVTGIPAGTRFIIAEYNDKDYRPLSRNGGHGTIAYQVSGTSARLPAVPGMTANLPRGVSVVKKARATGQFASDGYLPPCSNGRRNMYAVELKAIDAQGKVLDKVGLNLGRY